MYLSYTEYKKLKDEGLRKEANSKTLELIQEYLNSPNLNFINLVIEEAQGDKLQFELYREIVFPELLKGYRNADIDSYKKLALTIQNIYDDEKIHLELGGITEIDLLKKIISLDSNNGWALAKYINAQIEWLKYCIHEWPSGILYNGNGANLNECTEILNVVDEVLGMNNLKEHCELLNDVKTKTLKYIETLDNKSILPSADRAGKS